MSAAQRFAALFGGNSSAYGTVQGECIKAPVTSQTWQDHLYREKPLGVYPIDEEGWAHWGCVDIDTGFEMVVQAINLKNVLAAMGITAFVERTKGSGYHCWVLPSAPLSPATVRRTLLVACSVAGVDAKEVNPKQESLSVGQVGSYVNLPYPDGYSERGRRVVIEDDGTPLSLEVFLDRAERSRQGAAPYLSAASLYVPPVPVRIDPNAEYNGDLYELVGQLAAAKNRSFPLFRDGPLEGKDRSGSLFYLACLIAQIGLKPEECLALLIDADARWGKYHSRRDGVLLLERTVQTAYEQSQK